MENDKKYSAKEVAVQVLQKAQELLEKSDTLKKYSSEMSSKLGYKPFPVKEAQPEKTDKAYEVEPGKAKNDARMKIQKDPNKNPKEKAEGNNAAPGAFPQNVEKYIMEKDEKLNKKYEGFKAVEESARESGANDPAAVAAAIGRKKYGKEAFQHAAAKGKKMGKSDELKKDGFPSMPNVPKPIPPPVASGIAGAFKNEEDKAMALPKEVGTVKLAKFLSGIHSKRGMKK